MEKGQRGEGAAPCGLCIDGGHIGALVFHINNNKNKKTEQGKSYVNGSVRGSVCVCEKTKKEPHSTLGFVCYT